VRSARHATAAAPARPRLVYNTPLATRARVARGCHPSLSLPLRPSLPDTIATIDSSRRSRPQPGVARGARTRCPRPQAPPARLLSGHRRPAWRRAGHLVIFGCLVQKGLLRFVVLVSAVAHGLQQHGQHARAQALSMARVRGARLARAARQLGQTSEHRRRATGGVGARLPHLMNQSVTTPRVQDGHPHAARSAAPGHLSRGALGLERCSSRRAFGPRGADAEPAHAGTCCRAMGVEKSQKRLR
jgi:hypothetical protein